MLQVSGFKNLKEFMILCIKLGQANPFQDAKKNSRRYNKGIKEKNY